MGTTYLPFDVLRRPAKGKKEGLRTWCWATKLTLKATRLESLRFENRRIYQSNFPLYHDLPRLKQHHSPKPPQRQFFVPCCTTRDTKMLGETLFGLGQHQNQKSMGIWPFIIFYRLGQHGRRLLQMDHVSSGQTPEVTFQGIQLTLARGSCGKTQIPKM